MAKTCKDSHEITDYSIFHAEKRGFVKFVTWFVTVGVFQIIWYRDFMAYLKEMLFFFVRSWVPKIQAIRNNLLLTNPCDIGGSDEGHQGWCISLLNEELKNPRILKITG